MNNARRKEIDAIRTQLEAAQSVLNEIAAALEGIRDDEQCYLDDMPESIQSGDKGDRAQAAIDALDEATGAIEELDFDAIYNALEEAAA